MTTEHTPDPWFVIDPLHGHATEYKCVQIGADEMYSTLEMKPEDARRIVACVNACAGISTEALESGAIKQLLGDCQVLHAIALSMPPPKLGEWDWTDIVARTGALLERVTGEKP